MAMRTIVAAAASVSGLFLGLWAISEQAQQVQPSVSTAAGNASYNVSVEVFEGMWNGGAQGVGWFAPAAVVLVACGFLVYAATTGGGR